jgi:hypothetical protein
LPIWKERKKSQLPTWLKRYNTGPGTQISNAEVLPVVSEAEPSEVEGRHYNTDPEIRNYDADILACSKIEILQFRLKVIEFVVMFK